MNDKTNKILTNLLEYKKTFKSNILLAKAIENMEFTILSTAIGRLFKWQKYILLEYDHDDDYLLDKFLIDEVSQKHYNSLFDYCPQLSEVFHLGGGEIKYNESLTEEDKEEIREYIHENYEIKVKVTIRKPKN